MNDPYNDDDVIRRARRVRDAGLGLVMDRCPAIEWGRLDSSR